MFSVRYRPTIIAATLLLLALSLFAATATTLIPASAPHGARVLIVGTGLDANDVTVAFTDASGNPAAAAVVSRAATVLEVVVPPFAATGVVKVTRGSTLLASPPFTVAPDPSFVRIMTLAASDKTHDVFKQPSAVAVAFPSGPIYVADSQHHQVAVLRPDGTISSIVGSGRPGLADGSTTQAQFREPRGICVDSVRQIVYVSDTGNNAIRKMTFDGAVSTFVGAGHEGASDGAGAQASFKQPTGLAIDANGNIYVSDTGNNAIRMITPDGVVSTIAGGVHEGFANGPVAQALFKQPQGVAVSATGVIYVADTKNNVIRKIENGVVSTVAGTGHDGPVDGAGNLAEFKEPSGITIDEAGNLLVADTKNDAVRKIVFQPSGAMVSTIVVGGASVTLKDPAGIAFAGRLYVADSKNDALQVFDPAPDATAIYPTRGPLAGGNTIRVFGTGFVPGATQVSFGGIDATEVTFVASTEILATVPPASAGTVDVKVTTPAGNGTIASGYGYLATPTISSVTPAKGKIAGGETIAIVGTNFVDGDTTVTIGGRPSEVHVSSPATLTALTPFGTAGAANVVVATPGGTATLAGGFAYFALPAITSFSPASGLAGTTVTIAGQNFDPDVAGDQVKLGSTPAAISSATAAQLVITIPSGGATSRLIVTTAGGTVQSASDFVVASPVSLVSLALSPNQLNLTVGDSEQLKATASYSDGSTRDVTSSATWTSANNGIATVSSTGVATARGAGGTTITASLSTVSASAVLQIAPAIPLPPDPATIAPALSRTVVATMGDQLRFLYTGLNAIQAGVAAGAINDDRATLLRGTARIADNQPLPGVVVSVLGHSELGQTVTRADGAFDLVINGGGAVTLRFEKSGYISAQRLVRAQWNEEKPVTDVVLVPYDTRVTTVVMGATDTQIARGTPSSDTSGIRQATLLIPTGTTAVLVMQNGSTTPVNTLNIRATEFSVGPNGPKAMPAPLPPTSGYTYCVELSSDEATAAGATEVRLSKTAAFYVENFLNFPVGMAVPTGYYDRTKASWIGSTNGVVVKILSSTNGLADLDVDGDGAADSPTTLASRGIDDAERQKLAALYTTGQTLWRVPITHFTPWDCNWPVAPPADAVVPHQPQAEWIPAQGKGSCKISNYSDVDCTYQTLGESIDINGTPYRLEYNSARVAHTQYKTTVHLSGDSVPASLQRIDLSIAIAGRTFSWTFNPQPNLDQLFEWDGYDVYGRLVQGAETATINIGYVYTPVYLEPLTAFNQAWARVSGVPVTGSRARNEITLSQIYLLQLGHFGVENAGFAGWSLNAQRFYDGNGRVIYDSDGAQRAADPRQDQQLALSAVAGNGTCCDTGEGGQATRAALDFPVSVAAAPDGTFYISETNKIKKISNGVITTIAGTTNWGVTADGRPAAGGSIFAWDVATGPDGTLYVNDNYRVRKIVNGVWSTIVGNGTRGNTTVPVDGRAGLAVSVDPQGIAVASDGTVYVAEGGRVIAVGKEGIVRLVAGGSLSATLPPDGVPATQAAISAYGVAVGPDGSIYIADGSRAVRRITPDGIIHLFAGSDSLALPKVSDGQPATSGLLSQPWGISVAPDGTVLVGELGNGSRHNRVRAIAPNGIITTLVGSDEPTPRNLEADGTLARAANVKYPWDVEVAADGSVYFVDYNWNVVRRAAKAFPAVHSTNQTLVASDDGSAAFIFDGGRHVKTVDTFTNVTLETLSYDANGYVSAITDLDGNVTSIERNSAGNMTGIVAPGGQRTALTVANGQLTQSVDPMGATRKFSYLHGLLTEHIDARGGVHSFTYDADSLLVRDAGPDGGVITLNRTGATRDFVVTKTSAEGRTDSHQIILQPDNSESRRSIDRSGFITATLENNATTNIGDPDGSKVTAIESPDPRFGQQAPFTGAATITLPSNLKFSFAHSRAAVLSDPLNPLSLSTLTDTVSVNGRTFKSSFDRAASQWTFVTPETRQTTAALDSKGRLSQISVPGMTPVMLAYNSIGELSASSEGARVSAFAYDSLHRLSSITDSLARTTRLEYDAAGRLTTRTLPDGRAISYAYDPDGNITSVTPPGRPKHSFAFTTVGLEASYTAPTSGATQYAYNRDRQLTLVTRPDATTLALSYDAGGRLATVTTAHGQKTYLYDSSNGTLRSLATPDGTVLTFAFDGPFLKRVDLAGTVAGSVTFAYDNDFRLISQNGLGFSYDGDGLLSTAGDLALAHNQENGLLSGTTIGLVSDTYRYNDFGEIVGYDASYNGSPLLSLTYTRDNAGRIVSKAESIAGAAATAFDFSYDAVGRLTGMSSGGAAVSTYAYDSNGNRTTATTTGGSATGAYDTEDRLLSYGDAAYTYTQNGELHEKTILGQTTTFTYDEFGNLRHVAIPGLAIDYIVDGQDRRIGKQVNGALVQGWLYGNQLNVVAQMDGSGATVSTFVYGSRGNVPDYMVKGGVTYRLISDHVGSPRLIVNTTDGSVAEQIDYDEFGRILTDTNPGFQPFGFAGGLLDRDTGFVHFGARDYDPQTGRWTSKDPLGFAASDTNLFAYTFDDPVNFVDESGMDAVTQDPVVRNCFYMLWKQSGYGHDERERSTWVTNANNQYHTQPWPWSATVSHDKWKGPIPPNVVALGHTHPDSKDPKPSTGGDASNPTDDYAAQQINKPVYTISRKGIWKVDPQGNVTKEEGPNWTQGIDPKKCACN